MVLLIVGLLFWWQTHLMKTALAGLRGQVAERAGEGGTKLLMTGLTLVSVALMVVGYQQAAYVNIWFPPAWTVHLTNLLMLLAFIVFFAGGLPSILRTWIRHPQLTGLKMWAVGHLLVNGDMASVVLFGGLLAWAVVALILINKRDGKGPKPTEWTVLGTAANVGIGVAAFGIVAWVHNYLGVWPFPG